MMTAALPAYAADDGPTPSPVIPTAPMQEAVGANGVFVGETARVHPFGMVDLHWVTNPGFLPPNVPQVSDLLLVGRVGLDGAWKHTAWDLNYLGEIAYNKYFGLQQAGSADLSGFSGHANINSTMNKGSNFVLRVNGDLMRANDVANQTFTERLLHWITQASASAEMRPGGGALVITAGFGYFWDKYDDFNTPNYPKNLLDNWRYLPDLRVAWRFLPKTSLFLEGSAQLARFDDVDFPATTAANIDSDIVSGSIGIAGSLTNKVTTLIQGGYTNTLMEAGDDNLQTGTGAAIFEYAGETVKVRGGVLRSVQPASLFRYFTLNRVFLKYDQQMATRTVVSLSPEVNLLQYGSEIVGGESGRLDLDYVLVATLTQALSEWWTIALTDRVNYRQSNFSSTVGTTGYFFNDVFVSLRLRY